MQKKFVRFTLFIFVVLFSYTVEAQWRRTMKWRAIFSVGFNYPFEGGFSEGVAAQAVNFPTVNLGIQRMFKQEYGLRLDYGFNRFSNDSDSPEFKINYTRFNLQFVYDPTKLISWIPERMAIPVHAGPGISFSKPLGGISDRNQTYANLMGGLEVHYAITRRLSVFGDVSYIWGITSIDDYDPPASGLGAFNGSLLNFTIGLSISLSGCQFCD